MFGLHAFSEAPFSALLEGQQIQAEELTIRFASKSFATRGDDTPAHIFFDGRLMSGLTIGRRLTAGPDGQFGSLIEATFGEIELANHDGGLNSLIQAYYADGRQIRVKIGATEIFGGRERVKNYTSFATVYSAVAGDWSIEGDSVRLRVATLASRLQDRLQSQTYAGSGGVQGTEDMTGRTVPTAFGRCLNVPAQVLDPTVLTFDLHGGPLDSITAVYDAGIALGLDVDYATYDELATSSVLDGEYSSCLAAGKIKLGLAPTGSVTADIQGDNQLFDARGYTDEHGGVMKKILMNYSDLVDSQIDLASFDALDVLQPASMGLFLPAGDQSTIEQVLEQIAFSCGAFVGQDRSGLYRVQRLDAPAANQHWTFTDRELLDLRQERLPYRIPWKSWGIGYQRNWTTQTGTDLAGGVTQERRAFLEAEYRYVYAQEPNIALQHFTSSGAPLVSSLFIDKTVAETEAQRRIALYGLGRAYYRVIVPTALFSVEIGQTVRLISNKYGLTAGRNCVVVSIDDDAGSDTKLATTEMLVFG